MKGSPTSPLTLDASNDATNDLTIEIRYTDRDGNLGGGKVEVHDCRAAGVVTRYTLPAIASRAAVAAHADIDGTLTIVVPDVEAVEPSAKPDPVCKDLGAEPTSFCVVLIDAAGNASGGACTPKIVVKAS